jgi:thymidylate synthase ThyX
MGRLVEHQVKSGFKADIIADSINPTSNRITTFLLTYPRFIHSEIMTHRAFSRNAASSRAIPIEKVMEQVRTSPAGPIRWGKNGKGMQDHGELEGHAEKYAIETWHACAESARSSAASLNYAGLHKQIVNRVLEPFAWMTTLVTATELENFFSLRVHKDAQPEFQHLAYMMLKVYLANNPAKMAWGGWHIPFGDRIEETDNAVKLKVATARAARTSYLTIDGKIDVAKDIELHDRLAESGHWSPFEHAAMAQDGRHGNYVGWVPYRKTFPNENRKCDLQKLLSDYEATIGVS